MLYALDRELLHGDYEGRLTDADASCLLLDELHQSERAQQNATQQGAAIAERAPAALPRRHQ
jgi:hypothetical protein